MILSMKEAVAISGLAEVLAEKSRATILLLLLSGKAYSATELASATGLTKQTTSFHLAKLCGSQLVKAVAQGRAVF